MATKAQLQDEIRRAMAVGDEKTVRVLSIQVLQGQYDKEPAGTGGPEVAEVAEVAAAEQPGQINDALSQYAAAYRALDTGSRTR